MSRKCHPIRRVSASYSCGNSNLVLRFRQRLAKERHRYPFPGPRLGTSAEAVVDVEQAFQPVKAGQSKAFPPSDSIAREMAGVLT